MSSLPPVDSEPDSTQPQVIQRPQTSKKPVRSGLWRLLRWLLPALLLIVVGASLAGYASGSARRQELQQEAARARAAEQFDLGVQDLAAGRYELARQRFDYVLEVDPSYPQLAERIAEVLLASNQPSAAPTVVASPTPNLAPVEELFTQAQSALDNGDWNLAIDTLLTLRSKDAGYQAVAVDGMLYQALRNRGIHRISAEGLLEEGMYDLAQAETFGPLDRDANNWRSWAELYLTANSYMGLNWGQAVAHFAQVYLVAPYLRNDAYIKYAISAQNYANQLVDAGDPCAAEDLYDESLLAWDNATLYPTATEVRNICRTATTKPRAPDPTETPTPGGETPTPTATEEGDG